MNEESNENFLESEDDENEDSDIDKETETLQQVEASVSPTNNRSTGRVKFFAVDKGYGFITNDDGSGDLFVHQSQIHCEGFRALAEDEEVEFDIEQQDDGKTKAINVTGPNGDYCKGQPKGGSDRGRGRGRGRGGWKLEHPGGTGRAEGV